LHCASVGIVTHFPMLNEQLRTPARPKKPYVKRLTAETADWRHTPIKSCTASRGLACGDWSSSVRRSQSIVSKRSKRSPSVDANSLSMQGGWSSR
jgi:hypothetical protein